MAGHVARRGVVAERHEGERTITRARSRWEQMIFNEQTGMFLGLKALDSG